METWMTRLGRKLTASADRANAEAAEREERSSRPRSGTSTIGLVIGSIANPFYGQIARAVEDIAAARGSVVITVSLDEDEARERKLVHELLRRNIDGLVIAPTARSQAYLSPELEAGTKIVCVDRMPAGIPVDSYVSANYEGALLGVNHLLERGHRKITFLGDTKGHWTARERERGYRDALAAAGIAKSKARVVGGLYDQIVAREKTLELLDSGDLPTAIFSSQNLITLGAIHALQERGLYRSTALVGFDDFAAADLIRPGVTVVAQDPYLMGERAAGKLFARIDGDESDIETGILPINLIERGSGEVPVRVEGIRV